MKKYCYVALLRGNEQYKSCPLFAAENLEQIKKELDEYNGVTQGYKEYENPTGKFVEFVPFRSKYPDDFEGYYVYETKMMERTDIDKFDIYCINLITKIE